MAGAASYAGNPLLWGAPLSSERFVPLQLPPGLYHNGTPYEAKGRWFHGSLIRWHQGTMGPIGGWRAVLDATGTPIMITADVMRSMIAWHDNGGTNRAMVGGAQKLYAYTDQTLTDITPVALVTGRRDATYASGYGSGPYGGGFYGVGAGALTLQPADTWSFDTFGEVGVACLTSDGHLFQTEPPGSQATVITNAPGGCRAVVVTPERFLVALGANGDPRQVAWASQGSLTVWAPSLTNSAGALLVPGRGRLVTGRRTRTATLLWTDVEAIALTYIGGSLIYRPDVIGDNCGIAAPNACAVIGDSAVWMGTDKFFIYDGQVRPLDCDVYDYVFSRLNLQQVSKVFCVTNSKFNEVTWFYPSGTNLENDSYVTYNYHENHWTYGALARNCGVDRGIFDTPIWVDNAGQLWQHEVGSPVGVGHGLTSFTFDSVNLTWDSTTHTFDEVFVPSIFSAVGSPFVESGPVDLGAGDQIVHATRFLTDELTLGSLMLTLFASFNPTDAEQVIGPLPMLAPMPLRFAGRWVRIRYDQLVSGAWRIGTPRLGVVPGGYR